jgi:hypothetical protein
VLFVPFVPKPRDLDNCFRGILDGMSAFTRYSVIKFVKSNKAM